MSTPRPNFQTFFTVFVAVTGVLSLFPFRERALLPAPNATEQGLLAQDISAQGSSQLVNDTITRAGSPIPGALNSGVGARRLIAGVLRGADVPGAGGITGGTTAALPGTGGTGPNGSADGGNAPGLASTNLAGGPGGTNAVGGPGTSGGNGPITGPQAPAALSGSAGELLAAVVPEPSTWLLFIFGLMAMGQALRMGRRSEISSLSRL